MALCFKQVRFFFFFAILMLVGCGTDGTAPSITSDPFDGYACNTTVATDLTASEFEALLQAGSSSSSPYRICLKSGVEINSAEASLSVNVNNVEIRGANTKDATLHNVTAAVSGASNLVRFVNVNIVGDATGGLSIQGSGTYEVITSTIKGTGEMMEEVFHIYNGPTVFVSGSSITSTSSSSDCALCFLVQTVSTALTLENSVITFGGESGLKFIHQGGSGTVNLKGNTFKATNSSTLMDGPHGITVLSQGGTGTLNDTSGSTKNFVCEIAGITDQVDNVFYHINQGGSFGGTFNVSNTQNGNNTNIGTCP